MLSIFDVLTAVAAEVEGLDILIGTSPVALAVLKQPLRSTETIAEGLTICPSEQPGGEVPYAFGKRLYRHNVDVVLIGRNDGDMVANIEEYGSIIQRLLFHFSKPLPDSLPTARDVTSRPTNLFNRKAMNEANLDVLSIEVSVTEVVQVT